jgi:hypothetical protein
MWLTEGTFPVLALTDITEIPRQTRENCQYTKRNMKRLPLEYEH